MVDECGIDERQSLSQQMQCRSSRIMLQPGIVGCPTRGGAHLSGDGRINSSTATNGAARGDARAETSGDEDEYVR